MVAGSFGKVSDRFRLSFQNAFERFRSLSLVIEMTLVDDDDTLVIEILIRFLGTSKAWRVVMFCCGTSSFVSYSD